MLVRDSDTNIIQFLKLGMLTNYLVILHYLLKERAPKSPEKDDFRAIVCSTIPLVLCTRCRL